MSESKNPATRYATDIFGLRSALQGKGFPIIMSDWSKAFYVERDPGSSCNSAMSALEKLYSAIMYIRISNEQASPPEKPTNEKPGFLEVICEMHTDNILTAYFYEHPTLKVLIPVKRVS